MADSIALPISATAAMPYRWWMLMEDGEGAVCGQLYSREKS
jgi:hypothetical protein